MFPVPEAAEFVELLLLYICAGMSCPLLKALSVFLLETTLSESRAGQESCQFHLPILYHHLYNAGRVVIA